MFTPDGFAKFLLHEIGEKRLHDAKLIALEEWMTWQEMLDLQLHCGDAA